MRREFVVFHSLHCITTVIQGNVRAICKVEVQRTESRNHDQEYEHKHKKKHSEAANIPVTRERMSSLLETSVKGEMRLFFSSKVWPI